MDQGAVGVDSSASRRSTPPGVASSAQPASWSRRTDLPPRNAALRACTGSATSTASSLGFTSAPSGASSMLHRPDAKPCGSSTSTTNRSAWLERRAPSAAGTSISRAQMQSNTSTRARAAVGQHQLEGVVDAAVAGRDGGDPVDLAQVPPQLALGLGRRADEEGDLGLPGRTVPVPAVDDLVGDGSLDIAGGIAPQRAAERARIVSLARPRPHSGVGIPDLGRSVDGTGGASPSQLVDPLELGPQLGRHHDLDGARRLRAGSASFECRCGTRTRRWPGRSRSGRRSATRRRRGGRPPSLDPPGSGAGSP